MFSATSPNQQAVLEQRCSLATNGAAEAYDPDLAGSCGIVASLNSTNPNGANGAISGGQQSDGQKPELSAERGDATGSIAGTALPSTVNPGQPAAVSGVSPNDATTTAGMFNAMNPAQRVALEQRCSLVMHIATEVSDPQLAKTCRMVASLNSTTATSTNGAVSRGQHNDGAKPGLSTAHNPAVILSSTGGNPASSAGDATGSIAGIAVPSAVNPSQSGKLLSVSPNDAATAVAMYNAMNLPQQAVFEQHCSRMLEGGVANDPQMAKTCHIVASLNWTSPNNLGTTGAANGAVLGARKSEGANSRLSTTRISGLDSGTPGSIPAFSAGDATGSIAGIAGQSALNTGQSAAPFCIPPTMQPQQ